MSVLGILSPIITFTAGALVANHAMKEWREAPISLKQQDAVDDRVSNAGSINPYVAKVLTNTPTHDNIRSKHHQYYGIEYTRGTLGERLNRVLGETNERMAYTTSVRLQEELAQDRYNSHFISNVPRTDAPTLIYS